MAGLDPKAHPTPPSTSNRIERVASTYAGNVAGPEVVATRIEHAITAKHPRTRYPITPQARTLLAARRLLPDRPGTASWPPSSSTKPATNRPDTRIAAPRLARLQLRPDIDQNRGRP